MHVNLSGELLVSCRGSSTEDKRADTFHLDCAIERTHIARDTECIGRRTRSGISKTQSTLAAPGTNKGITPVTVTIRQVERAVKQHLGGNCRSLILEITLNGLTFGNRQRGVCIGKLRQREVDIRAAQELNRSGSGDIARAQCCKGRKAHRCIGFHHGAAGVRIAAGNLHHAGSGSSLEAQRTGTGGRCIKRKGFGSRMFYGQRGPFGHQHTRSVRQQCRSNRAVHTVLDSHFIHCSDHLLGHLDRPAISATYSHLDKSHRLVDGECAGCRFAPIGRITEINHQAHRIGGILAKYAACNSICKRGILRYIHRIFGNFNQRLQLKWRVALRIGSARRQDEIRSGTGAGRDQCHRHIRQIRRKRLRFQHHHAVSCRGRYRPGLDGQCAPCRKCIQRLNLQCAINHIQRYTGSKRERPGNRTRARERPGSNRDRSRPCAIDLHRIGVVGVDINLAGELLIGCSRCTTEGNRATAGHREITRERADISGKAERIRWRVAQIEGTASRQRSGKRIARCRSTIIEIQRTIQLNLRGNIAPCAVGEVTGHLRACRNQQRRCRISEAGEIQIHKRPRGQAHRAFARHRLRPITCQIDHCAGGHRKLCCSCARRIRVADGQCRLHALCNTFGLRHQERQCTICRIRIPGDITCKRRRLALLHRNCARLGRITSVCPHWIRKVRTEVARPRERTNRNSGITRNNNAACTIVFKRKRCFKPGRKHIVSRACHFQDAGPGQARRSRCNGTFPLSSRG